LARPPRTTVLRDYYGPAGGRVTTLVDYSGVEQAPRSLFYRLGDRLLRANNELIDRVLGVPGQMRDNLAILRDPVQRKLLAQALVDEQLLTPRRRRALFSLVLWGTVLLAVAIGVFLLAFYRDAIPAYEAAYQLFFYGILTSLFLPTPFELLLSPARQEIGLLATVLVASAAKTVGSWLVLLMGDRANAGIKGLLERRPFVARVFGALERFAQRFGYFAVFVLFAIPYMSDTAPLFVLAVLRMRKGPFLATVAFAVAIRSLLYLVFPDLL